MANSMSDYVTAFKANLPSGITYDSDVADYVINGRRFPSEWEAERYRGYILKFGFDPLIDYAANGISPTLVANFSNDFYGKS